MRAINLAMDTVKVAVTLSCVCVFVWFACLCVPAQVAGLVPVPAKEAGSGRGSQKNTYTNACTHEHPLAPYLKGSDSSGSQCASEAPSHYHSFQDLSVLSGVETREKYTCTHAHTHTHTSLFTTLFEFLFIFNCLYVFCILPSSIRFHSPLSSLSFIVSKCSAWPWNFLSVRVLVQDTLKLMKIELQGSGGGAERGVDIGLEAEWCRLLITVQCCACRTMPGNFKRT